MRDEWRRAAIDGDGATIARLIAAGEGVDGRDRHGQTALMLAACNGRDQVVSVLLAGGADPDVTAKYGLSALMLAVINGHEAVARRLVEAGAALELHGSGAPGFAGKTAADLARDRGMAALARFIARHAFVASGEGQDPGRDRNSRGAAAPCRLSVFLARKAASAVILRRGPRRWTQLVSWDRERDRFTPGQWFHGRVYERRCDLSPDGRYFIYFAAKHGGRRHGDASIGEAWTAISRPPFFTALALWTNLGSWYGGGAFKSDGSVLLDATCSLRPHSRVRGRMPRFEPMPVDTSPWEQRLLSGGWRLLERGFEPRNFRRVGAREIWEQPCAGSAVKLCREVEDVDFRRFGGPHAEVFWLESGGELIPLEGATWADWDGPDRLVFVRQGRLFAARLRGTEFLEQELLDLNPSQPRQVVTPGWAKQW